MGDEEQEEDLLLYEDELGDEADGLLDEDGEHGHELLDEGDEEPAQEEGEPEARQSAAGEAQPRPETPAEGSEGKKRPLPAAYYMDAADMGRPETSQPEGGHNRDRFDRRGRGGYDRPHNGPGRGQWQDRDRGRGRYQDGPGGSFDGPGRGGRGQRMRPGRGPGPGGFHGGPQHMDGPGMGMGPGPGMPGIINMPPIVLPGPIMPGGPPVPPPRPPPGPPPPSASGAGAKAGPGVAMPSILWPGGGGGPGGPSGPGGPGHVRPPGPHPPPPHPPPPHPHPPHGGPGMGPLGGLPIPPVPPMLPPPIPFDPMDPAQAAMAAAMLPGMPPWGMAPVLPAGPRPNKWVRPGAKPGAASTSGAAEQESKEAKEAELQRRLALIEKNKKEQEAKRRAAQQTAAGQQPAAASAPQPASAKAAAAAAGGDVDAADKAALLQKHLEYIETYKKLIALQEAEMQGKDAGAAGAEEEMAESRSGGKRAASRSVSPAAEPEAAVSVPILKRIKRIARPAQQQAVAAEQPHGPSGSQFCEETERDDRTVPASNGHGQEDEAYAALPEFVLGGVGMNDEEDLG